MLSEINAQVLEFNAPEVNSNNALTKQALIRNKF